jgi:hypothetical protein
MLEGLRENTKLIRAFIATVRDPERTDQIFHVITNPAILNRQSLDQVLNKLRSDSQSAKMLTERYNKTWDLDELLQLPPNSFGYRYAKHMRDLGLQVDFYPPVPGDSDDSYLQLRSRATHVAGLRYGADQCAIARSHYVSLYAAQFALCSQSFAQSDGCHRAGLDDGPPRANAFW